jgi:hypothetical protein
MGLTDCVMLCYVVCGCVGVSEMCLEKLPNSRVCLTRMSGLASVACLASPKAAVMVSSFSTSTLVRAFDAEVLWVCGLCVIPVDPSPSWKDRETASPMPPALEAGYENPFYYGFGCYLDSNGN